MVFSRSATASHESGTDRFLLSRISSPNSQINSTTDPSTVTRAVARSNDTSSDMTNDNSNGNYRRNAISKCLKAKIAIGNLVLTANPKCARIKRENENEN